MLIDDFMCSMTIFNTENEPCGLKKGLEKLMFYWYQGLLSFQMICGSCYILQNLQGGSSGTLDKDKLPPFSQDVQNIVYTKKSTLPETSFELVSKITVKTKQSTLPETSFEPETLF